MNETADREAEQAGLYVDIENLQLDGQAMVQGLITDWPVGTPRPHHLALYVEAPRVEQWKLWAESQFADLEVVVRGTQHFSASPKKNSADIALAAHVMADLVLRRITHAAILSDDSDFISLFTAIRDEPAIHSQDGSVPFTWIVTDRDGPLSEHAKKFFPPGNLHVVKSGSTEPTKQNSALSQGKGTKAGEYEVMAQSVIERIEVGSFKSTDCQAIVSERFSGHSLAKANGPTFGAEFKNNVWPILEGYGVKIANPGKKPIRYEMTEAAKKKSQSAASG